MTKRQVTIAVEKELWGMVCKNCNHKYEFHFLEKPFGCSLCEKCNGFNTGRPGNKNAAVLRRRRMSPDERSKII